MEIVRDCAPTVTDRWWGKYRRLSGQLISLQVP
jgi:hypothetical protein